ncbi:unnamed protein product [Ceutorhynchus assimilis]|uniref:C2H2-type domain-containing protein n=1 Tax=Ceutorhynchus assimilis TaxID=467358 RepID=A0A9N9MLN3_9CUCU|nr:unnamed protein product [Ceutorhynchus assimilis]
MRVYAHFDVFLLPADWFQRAAFVYVVNFVVNRTVYCLLFFARFFAMDNNKIDKLCCKYCKNEFGYLYNLRKHVNKFHSDDEDYLKTISKHSNSEFKFSCKMCHKNFNHKKNLKFHTKTHERQQDQVPEISTGITTEFNEPITGAITTAKCAMCQTECINNKAVLLHYAEAHDIVLKKKSFILPKLDEFYAWKRKFESDTNSRFFKVSSSNSCKTHKYIRFTCHRSGQYVPEGKGVRHLKTQGSNKINAVCPATITLKHRFSDGICEIQVQETHVGHQNEIGHLNLTKIERESLAGKIALKIPFDEILDDIRNSICDNTLKRLHLLTKKDLFNIEFCYNLSSTSMRHSNDVVSVNSWIHEMQEKGQAILFYKPQGSLNNEYPILKESDFVLVIMTDAQSEILKKYSSDCVCIDGTHGTNSYNFELTTLLVVDDMREGFPCGFLISNRSDKDVFIIFCNCIKTRIGGGIVCNVFMSDMAEAFFNAWIEVMPPPKQRLFCSWHVDRAWRNNLSKIKTTKKRVIVYKTLRAILQETDIHAFDKMLIEFNGLVNADNDTQEFGIYFNKEYMPNMSCWAYCFRIGAGVNTNMHLERMHRTLKYTYLKGKHVKRLDKGINAIMCLVRDKCIERLITINKGKLSSKLSALRSRHKTSLTLDLNSVMPCDDGWNVASGKKTDLYLIRQVKDHCECHLICIECNTCLHRFICSCHDSSIEYNMCKHIHLLCKSLASGVCTSPNTRLNEANERQFGHC